MSIHARLAESDRQRRHRRKRKGISIHALLAESDPTKAYNIIVEKISIHALLAESDDGVITRGQLPASFLSTLSLRRATSPPDFCYLDNIISIHALLAESDEFRKLLYPGATNFYPRSPCGERPDGLFFFRQAEEFLSTLSLRRATNGANANLRGHRDFYPRSPCGERP